MDQPMGFELEVESEDKQAWASGGVLYIQQGSSKSMLSCQGVDVWKLRRYGEVYQENPSFTFHAFFHFFMLFCAFLMKSTKRYVLYLPEYFLSCPKK
jgi:hypothetical protein